MSTTRLTLSILVTFATVGAIACSSAKPPAPPTTTEPPSATTTAAPALGPWLPPPPPTVAGGDSTPVPGARFVIPAGLLVAENIAKTPLSQQGVSWTVQDSVGLPPLPSPCNAVQNVAGQVVAARQAVLVNEGHLWKSARLVVYRDVATARAVMAAWRAAFATCPRQDADGMAAKLANEPWTKDP